MYVCMYAIVPLNINYIDFTFEKNIVLDGSMGGWRDVKAVLRIANSNKKEHCGTMCVFLSIPRSLMTEKWILECIFKCSRE